VVFRLLVQRRDKIGPSGGKLGNTASPFRPARWRTSDTNEHDRQAMPTECVSQSAGVLHDLAGWVYGGQSDDAVLQIDDDESGLRVKGRYCHGVLLLVIWTAASGRRIH
jgi:hypothetical protein